MGIEDGTTDFTLSKPIEFRSGGNPAFSDRIVLKEPGMDHIKHYLKLKQMITRAYMDLAAKAGQIAKMKDQAIGEQVKPFVEDIERLESEAKEVEDGISVAMQAAENVDIGDFIDTFAAMACLKGRKSICMIDDQQAMTTALWATLKPDDAFNIAIRWCAFFGMPSLDGVKTTSDQQ